MDERDQPFAAQGDADATLVTPRFDEQEAETARPVVPLAEATEVGVYGAGRRRWPLALVLASALLGGVVSVFALRVYQGRQRAAAVQGVSVSQAPRQQEGEPQASSGAAVVATPEATPAQSGPSVAAVETYERPEPALKAAEAEKREEKKDGRREPGGARKGADEPRSTREAERRKDQAPAARADARPRRVETITYRDAERPARQRRDEAAVYDAPRDARRGEARRPRRRNVDRIRDIFEGPPPLR